MTFNPAEARDRAGRWHRLAGLMKSAGGFTHDVTSGADPTSGFAVGVGSKDGKDWAKLPHGTTSAKDLVGFAREHADELAKPHRAIGGWSNDNPDYGEVRDALDIVEVHQNLADALAAARTTGQDAIYDLGKKEEIPVTHDLSIYTPTFAGTYDLSMDAEDGKLAFWKQILPKRQIHYTAKDGTRRLLNFDDKYLHDLATNAAVDTVGFLLADKDNAHTMDPERFRGQVAKFEVREDGLYGKIVFPNREAAAAVIANPNLGVSARIREGVERSDGSKMSRGIIHVLGTLDPQVGGMSGWQHADLSNTDENLLDLTTETYEDGTTMTNTLTKPVSEYTDADIDAMTEEEVEVFLAALAAEFPGILDEYEDDLNDNEQGPTVSLSNESRTEIDLARSEARAARVELAQTRWTAMRDAYMSAGVPVDLLDLSEPIFNRPSEFVVDLSNDGGDEINVGEIVRKLLDAAKGTIDLSVEQGHGGTFKAGDGEDPDAEALAIWEKQS